MVVRKHFCAMGPATNTNIMFSIERPKRSSARIHFVFGTFNAQYSDRIDRQRRQKRHWPMPAKSALFAAVTNWICVANSKPRNDFEWLITSAGAVKRGLLLWLRSINFWRRRQMNDSIRTNQRCKSRPIDAIVYATQPRTDTNGHLLIHSMRGKISIETEKAI